MKKLFFLIFFVAALMLPSASWGQECIVGNVKGIEPLDKEEVTVGNSAVGFNTAIVQQSAGNAAVVVVTVEDDSIRYWVDGSTPTITSGHLAPADSAFTICGLNSIKNFLAIRVTTDAAIKASFFRAR
jgi:hypothetical protein